MSNRHTAADLAQMQSLSLEAKIMMTKQRIKAWHDSWVRFEIYNEKTKKTRFVTYAVENPITDEPPMSEDEYVLTAIPGAVYVSFSGGKDSTVLKHIVDSMYTDIPALFVNTGLEYPEIQQFVREIKNGKYDCFNSDVEIVRPEMRFDEVLKKYGYPVLSKETALYIRQCQNPTDKNGTTRRLRLEGIRSDGVKVQKGEIPQKWKYLVDSPIPVSEKCCDVMKKKPAKAFSKLTGRKPIIGTMASESQIRYRKWLQNGCNAFDKKDPSSQPLSFWTEQDVLQYIKEFDVPYCPIYGDITEKESGLTTTGADRTGCIFCMFGCHLEPAPGRFCRLKETHPKQYEYCINGGEMVDGKWQPSKEGLGLGKVLDYIGVDYK